MWNSTYFSQETTTSIYFGFDIYKLTADNKIKLDLLISELNGGTITLKGYTDFVGSELYNEILSNKRVNSVKGYLMQYRVKESSIIESIGLGETEEFNERAKNRRVDIIINGNENHIPTKKEKEFISLDAINGLDVGQSIALANMEFIPGEHFLQEYSKPGLNVLLEIMKNYPKLKIEIHGHICCHDSSLSVDGLDLTTQTFNLSENRAKYIYDYLVKNGISKSRLGYKGFAATKPLVEEITDEDMQKNRRVEIMIVDN